MYFENIEDGMDNNMMGVPATWRYLHVETASSSDPLVACWSAWATWEYQNLR